MAKRLKKLMPEHISVLRAVYQNHQLQGLLEIHDDISWFEILHKNKVTIVTDWQAFRNLIELLFPDDWTGEYTNAERLAARTIGHALGLVKT